MKFQKILPALLLIFLISSCATTYRITSDYEESVTFDSFKSYNYLEHNHNFPLGANPIGKQRIGRAIESELEDLGYQKAEDPDLLISWFVTVKTVSEYDYRTGDICSYCIFSTCFFYFGWSAYWDSGASDGAVRDIVLRITSLPQINTQHRHLRMIHQHLHITPRKKSL